MLPAHLTLPTVHGYHQISASTALLYTVYYNAWLHDVMQCNVLHIVILSTKPPRYCTLTYGLVGVYMYGLVENERVLNEGAEASVNCRALTTRMRNGVTFLAPGFGQKYALMVLLYLIQCFISIPQTCLPFLILLLVPWRIGVLLLTVRQPCCTIQRQILPGLSSVWL